MKKQLLFVDDESHVLDGFSRILRSQLKEWDLNFASSAAEATAKLAEQPFDVVISDVYMEGATGFDLLASIRDHVDYRDIPVVIVTGSRDSSLKKKALELGATDLLNKPIDREELIARIRNVIQLKEYQDQIKEHNHYLEQRVEERTRELQASRAEIVWRLAKAAESRDEETGDHVVRVGCYCRVIAQELGLDEEFLDLLFLASPLHDIGKIGIPDHVLLKPGKLDPDEWEIMKSHCQIGAEILRHDAKIMKAVSEWGPALYKDEHSGDQNPILKMASTIALSHHEKWDGSGYPIGLSGIKIPMESRIVAVADVYDALRSVRPYKRAFTEEEALDIINEQTGKHFDPEVVEAFLRAMPQIRKIRERFTDEPSEAVAA
jgi:putative two-component system response regulator